MADESTPGGRLRAARIAAGFSSAAKAAAAMGIGPSTYAGHENGQNNFDAEQAQIYARKFGVSAAHLLFGSKAPTTTKRNRVTTVPDLAIFAGMGGGGMLEVAVDDAGVPTDPDQIRGYWEFPDYMLRRFGDLKNIYAWEVRGDSMEPTLAGGAVVFVDTSQTKLPPDDIYAINFGDGLMVKRLKLIPRSELVAVISDNERYGADDLIRDDVKVWGRVIGWFQWRG